MPRNRRTLLLGIAATATLALSAGSAFACSCADYASAAEHVRATEVIFHGRVLNSATLMFSETRAETVFEVIESMKGGVSGRVRIRHPRDVCCICGITYLRGQTCWVFASRGQDGRLHTSACSAPRFPEAEYRQALAAT